MQDNKENHKGSFGEFFSGYRHDAALYDEVFIDEDIIDPVYKEILGQLGKYTKDELGELYKHARHNFFDQGITFNLPSDPDTKERIFPFDLLPRIIHHREWEKLEKGVIQRNLAINAFVHDVYHRKLIFKDRSIPFDLIKSSEHYTPAMEGMEPAGGIYNHVSGTDLVKHSDGEYYVLEDNVRCPSGISYVLSNRGVMKRTLFQLFGKYKVKPINEFTDYFLSMVQSVAPDGVGEPCCAVLTDGMQASAYFEHAFIARSMGVPLVEGKDLYVEKDKVFMKTLSGNKQVDVLYKRVDDEFFDPLVFNADSKIGVPGIMKAFHKGNLSLVNAPGCGVADDKAVYSYVPQMIRYYLGEEPILNNVHTYHCSDENDLKYVIENMEKLVIKPVDEYGGKGIMVGNTASKNQINDYKKKIVQNPRKYIAQPIMALSLHATFIEEEKHYEPRHIDLRTYTLLGKDMQYVLKGGLTRVALKEGNLIVNSSLGGGSKDTWVLE